MKLHSLRIKAGRRIRKFRKAKGFETIEDLAADIERRFGVRVDPDRIREIECGDKSGGVDVLYVLARAYDVDLDTLTGLEN